MKKPIIGIVTKHYLKEQIRADMYIRDEVKQAIFDNGGIAIGILLPKMEKNDVCDEWNNNLSIDENDNLISQINLCNGIIIQGGSICDNYEMIVAKYCYEKNIPILGLCCGQNVLVRALGGTTFKIKNPEKHNVNDKYVHDIKIDQNSKFYNFIKKNKIMVNSRHNKSVDKCPLLNKVAFDEDGYADVIESKDKKFYIGVRFHPESLYKIDEDHNKIFEAFINACKD